MNLNLIKLLVASALTLGLGAAAHAQTVIVRSLDAAEAAKVRAAIDASMQAASRGERIGMITGAINPQPQVSRGGVVSQELDASTLMFSVARVNAEGGVEMVCVNGADAAAKAMKAPAFAKRMTQLPKEHNHVSK